MSRLQRIGNRQMHTTLRNIRCWRNHSTSRKTTLILLPPAAEVEVEVEAAEEVAAEVAVMPAVECTRTYRKVYHSKS